jgi:urease accessory protein
LTPRSHGHAAWVYTSSYGGGLLGGDVTQLSVRVGPRAAAFLSSQASTKVYRSDRIATLELSAHVAADALLVVWPDPVVCFAGSSYRQAQQFEVDGSGTLVAVDWMTSGRRAAGERWRFDRYETRTRVQLGGRLVLADGVLLSAGEGALESRMGRFDVLANVAMVGRSLDARFVDLLARSAGRAIDRRADLLLSAAPLGEHGCILRVAGRSVQDVGGALADHLSFVTDLLGDDPWARKW